MYVLKRSPCGERELDYMIKIKRWTGGCTPLENLDKNLPGEIKISSLETHLAPQERSIILQNYALPWRGNLFNDSGPRVSDAYPCLAAYADTSTGCSRRNILVGRKRTGNKFRGKTYSMDIRHMVIAYSTSYFSAASPRASTTPNGTSSKEGQR
jgi:hypothetical protein